MTRPITCLLTSALGGTLLACGDDKPRDEPSQCAQLEQALCARTAECAELEQLSTTADRDAFLDECLQALDCRAPAPASGADFELCQASLETMPCDLIVEPLRQDNELIRPESCTDFFDL